MHVHPSTTPLEVVPLRTGTVDLNTRQVVRPGGARDLLTTREAALLARLAASPDTVVSSESLLRDVWGRAWSGEPTELGVVRNTLFKLRQKVERDAATPDHILTVQGEGYRFVPLRSAADMEPERKPGSATWPLTPSRLPAPGEPWSPAWDVGWSVEARQALEALQSPNRPVVLVAPWRGGKSWMLRRLLQGLTPDDAVVRLDPRAMPPETLTDLERCCELLALIVCEAVGLPEESAEAALSGAGPVPWRLKRWMGRTALPATRGRLVLALEDLDRLSTAPIFGDLMATLRSWADDDRAPWPRLRLLATSAVPVSRLTAKLASSPFNLGITVPLGGLAPQDLTDLAERAHLKLTAEQLSALNASVGRSPYLLRLVLAAALDHGIEAALAPDGLRAALEPARSEIDARLQARAGLREALRQAIQRPDCPPSDVDVEPLRRLGLLEGERPPLRSACPALTDLLLG